MLYINIERLCFKYPKQGNFHSHCNYHKFSATSFTVSLHFHLVFMCAHVFRLLTNYFHCIRSAHDRLICASNHNQKIMRSAKHFGYQSARICNKNAVAAPPSLSLSLSLSYCLCHLPLFNSFPPSCFSINQAGRICRNYQVSKHIVAVA